MKLIGKGEQPTPEEQELIEQDKKLSHAIYVASGPLNNDDDDPTARIEAGYAEINERALAAQMVVLGTTVALSTCAVEGKPHFTYLICSQWVEKAKLESLRLQSRILGGNHGGSK